MVELILGWGLAVAIYTILGAMCRVAFLQDFCSDPGNRSLYSLSNSEKKNLGNLVALFWPLPAVVVIAVVLTGALVWLVVTPIKYVKTLSKGFAALLKVIKGG